jgi:magnesium transporter
MQKPETDKINRPTELPNGFPEVVQKRWFCAARSPDGNIFKGGFESSGDFVSTVKGAAVAWVDYVTREPDFAKEALAVATELGFSHELVASLTGEARISYQDLDTELGIKLPSIQVRQFEVETYPLLLLMKQNFVLTIHPLNVDRRFFALRRYSDTILKKIPIEIGVHERLTMLLIRIIDEGNERNFEHLREIEERGDDINKLMMDPNTPRNKLGPEIYNMKHALITYLNALWDSVHVIHTLRYGDAEIISDDSKMLERLQVMAENVKGQIGLAEHMSDVLASGLEVLQTIYNNQLQSLNNRFAFVMTYFTIIGTALLVPNTIATMLGDPVFDLSSKDLVWYWPLMIGATSLATFLAYWWVRKKNWLPKKMD